MEIIHKKVLILAPHTDDGELGCGGTTAKFIENGNTVYHAVFSVCEQSVPGGLSQDTLEKEFLAASSVLGVKKNYIFRYPVRRFNEFRQSILEDMIQMRNEIEPDVVIMPGLNDIHQDHHVLAEEGLRAFKQSTLLCYEMVWNNLKVTTTAFVKLEQRHLDKKIEALQAYHSQWGIRSYFNKVFIESMATVRGIQVNTQYAEAFDVLRWIF